ncbi:MAG: chorismate synthase [archaeon]
MSDTIGKSFKVTTHGESHGDAVGCVIEGVPAGTEISLDGIQEELSRRRPGHSELSSARKEPDKLEVVSGIENGKATGAIKLQVRNVDARPEDYSEIMNKPRPGHADMAQFQKFGKIPAGGGRASGRETVGRVLAGAVAKQVLEKEGIEIATRIIEVHGMNEGIEDEILKTKADGDSVGGIVEITATGIPPGLGEPVFGKLDAELAKALMSIPAVKGVEIGAGFESAKMLGSENNDAIVVEDGELKTRTNNAGGILGGISNGMPIVCRIAVKPTSSIAKEQDTIDLRTMKPAKLSVKGRHDPCIVPRILPVAEAMVAIVILDHLLSRKNKGEQ